MWHEESAIIKTFLFLHGISWNDSLRKSGEGHLITMYFVQCAVSRSETGKWIYKNINYFVFKIHLSSVNCLLSKTAGSWAKNFVRSPGIFQVLSLASASLKILISDVSFIANTIDRRTKRLSRYIGFDLKQTSKRTSNFQKYIQCFSKSHFFIALMKM